MTPAGELRSCLLALRVLVGAHTGFNIGRTVREILKEYEIGAGQVGYCTLDNATNNDISVQTLHDELWMQAEGDSAALRNLSLGPYGQTWARWRRIRCFGHVLNLIARAALFGTDPEIYEAVAASVSQPSNEKFQHEVEVWKKLGPIGKLHNIVKWIKKSPQRYDRFVEVVKQHRSALGLESTVLLLKQDNKTRWNSTYMMIERAVELSEEISQFMDAEITRQAGKADDALSLSILEQRLTPDDWLVLQEYMRLLAPLWEATKALEGSPSGNICVGLGYVIPTLEFVLSEFETSKQRYIQERESSGGNNHYLMAIEHAWAKANDYYMRLDESPAYAAAIVLDPRRKWETLEDLWTLHPKWIEASRQQILYVWETCYKPERKETQQVSASQAPESRLRKYFAKSFKRRDAKVIDDEYKDWIGKPQEADDVDPLQYWAKEPISSLYPNLSRMALDILSIPCMSDEPERIFSLSGHLIAPRRSRLKPDIIEASECLGNWDRKGILRIGDHGLRRETKEVPDEEEVVEQSEDMAINMADDFAF